MTKPRLVLRRSLEERRQFLQQHSSRKYKHMGEVVGGTTAEMAAVCCCVPCSMVDFVVLTMYKVPAGICRNAMRKRRQGSLVMKRNDSVSSLEDSELSMHPAVRAAAERFMKPEVDKDAMELENEMWEKFYESGFWRSPSGRLG
ncbi:uncharacterized protein LOC112520993 [Cynara cardunculus var. scolymus]|uniref:Uncharacterized protein n=1 Tax=Cynara cardunculus var. scolymus TaxID=59895 RepID=A0A103XH30_CYNCS|nr:uncharacterized protein LOC112520993 [Cynara cardunculus var. scolymus]KVH90557.1 hypothetical protein Ccrd_007426 [Cynara cardunculus var. scolymus]